MSNEKKDSATSHRGISIIIQEDGRYYTLGKFYRSLKEAEAKIDRYWDYDSQVIRLFSDKLQPIFV